MSGERPVFHYDLSSPESYLAAERVNSALPEPPLWQPILLADLPGAIGPGAFRCADEREVHMAHLEQRAAAQGLLALRWPDPWPTDVSFAMRAAQYCTQIGRGVAFAQAAFRQAFAGGRDLSVVDNVCIAAAACELHPAALIKGAELRSTREGLARATQAAAKLGVREVPAVAVGERLFSGDLAVEHGAATLGAPA
ncbi:MAG TPA: DsbA family protein [Solirubrobacteraceae bacterium]|nr:DsbA family protein [Solirubrobacteraceae bacterium]